MTIIAFPMDKLFNYPIKLHPIYHYMFQSGIILKLLRLLYSNALSIIYILLYRQLELELSLIIHK